MVIGGFWGVFKKVLEGLGYFGVASPSPLGRDRVKVMVNYVYKVFRQESEQVPAGRLWIGDLKRETLL